MQNPEEATYHYIPSCMVVVSESCYVLADNLIDALRNSNGLEFLSIDQRLALIHELSKPVE